MHDYALFVATHCKNEKLVPFDRSGVAGLLEHSARLVEDQGKLSSQFMEIADLIRKASYWASKEGSKTVTREIIKKTISEKIIDNKVARKFKEKVKYYTLKDSQYSLIENKSDLLSILKERKKEVLGFIKENKLNFRKDMENVIISVAEFYNHL